MGTRGDLVARSVVSGPKVKEDEDVLTSQLTNLSLQEQTQSPKSGAGTDGQAASPADFFQLHRLRTSALARKTRTMSSYGGGNGAELLDELRGLGEEAKKEQTAAARKSEAVTKKLSKEESRDSGNEEEEDSAATEEKNTGKEVPKEESASSGTEADAEEEEEDGELIGRTPGPVQSARQGRLPVNYPYNAVRRPAQAQPPVIAGAVLHAAPAQFWQAQQAGGVYGQTATPYAAYPTPYPAYAVGKTEEALYGYPEPHHSYSPCAGTTGGDDASQSPGSCAVAAAACEAKEARRQESPFADGVVTTEELSRLLDVPAELPDDLSDFILKYSRRYSTDGPPLMLPGREEARSDSRKSSSSEGSSSSASPRHQPQARHLLEEPLGCDSPVSAGPAPTTSPAAPAGAASPVLPGAKPRIPVTLTQATTPPISARKGGNAARDRVRAQFGEKENEVACLWAVKCIQSCPGALYFRDPDGDSLLHIVVWHKDIPKIYALVELMLKTDLNQCTKPFDLPNRLHETPLYLAVQKRSEEVVSYLLEAGANPNFQTRKAEADAPLHYAAARGMTEIVEVLANHPGTDANLRNGLGLTPLLCAVKNHGVIEEESQCLVNNKPAIRALLKAGADPKVPEARNGKTVVHYAVERMDPELVDIYRDNLSPEVMAAVVNIPAFCGETPLGLLQRMGGGLGPRAGPRLQAEEELRRKMQAALVGAGAVTVAEAAPRSSETPSPYDSFDNA